MLDLLFTTGLPVRERAFALQHGDAVCMEASGPAAPSLEPPRVFLLVNMLPPHLSSVARVLGAPARWAPGLQSLGGPSILAAWATLLHCLANDEGRRPWRLLYVQGPAMGTSEALSTLIGPQEPDAELIVMVPSVKAPGLTGDLSIVRLDLTRSRNVWRFPSCNHSYAVEGDVPFQDAAVSLNGLVEQLDAGAAWTLHDLHIYQAEQVRFSAILRSAEPVALTVDGFTQRDIDGAERLMFPVNDVIGVLRSLAEQMAGIWGDALRQPLHFRVLPDGAQVYALVPDSPEWRDALPDRLGAITIEAELTQLASDITSEAATLAVDDSDFPGPRPAGIPAGVLWRLPPLTETADIQALARAFSHKLKTEG